MPVHIPGSRIVLADQGSRQVLLSTEWMLDPDLFESICQKFFPFPQIDLFATRATARLSCYVSPCPDQEALHEDALDPFFNWNRFQSIYAFPPPALLPMLVGRLRSFKGSMVLIAPLNLTAPWSIQIRKSPRRGSSLSVCRPRSGLSIQGVSTSPPCLSFIYSQFRLRLKGYHCNSS